MLFIYNMKLFRGSQIPEIDRYTIAHEPIASIDLMERAAVAILHDFLKRFGANHPVYIFAGPGNNGGDGLALARLLILMGYHVKVFVLAAENYSHNHLENIKRLDAQGIVKAHYLTSSSDFPVIPHNSIIVDSLFGSGLSRYLKDLAGELVLYLNQQQGHRVAIDIPSGLFSELNPSDNSNPVFCAHETISLQFPKLSFFFAENEGFVGHWRVVDIGLHPQAIEEMDTSFYWVDETFAAGLLPQVSRFAHKGQKGHCQVIAGSDGMYGAAALCAKSCLKADAGLVTVHVPQKGVTAIQTALPEVMVSADVNESHITGVAHHTSYDAYAIGPGLGLHTQTAEALQQFIENTEGPIVFDADALNLIAQNPLLLSHLPKGSVITPHVGEFNRLFGPGTTGYFRMETAMENAVAHGIIIVLKGAYTQIVGPCGNVYFNSTGNNAMATAGSGDVLTGIIASFLAQGIPSLEAAILGVFIHGKAGDLAQQRNGGGPITSGQIADALPMAMGQLYEVKNN